ncbi:sterol carrier protein [Candidatus Thorarchaeota archaeon]|nr:MAG: sterol carrier protein [Candidatus Thorarchaeota archaeon]
MGFLSEEWLAEYRERLNSNPDYAESAKTWEGDLIFQIDADGERIAEPIRAYVDLWHGECREARVAGPDDNAEFTYSASIDNWRRLLGGEIGPIRGIISRKFKLQGSMSKVMRYIKAAQVKVETASTVPTKFQDE